MAQTLISPCDPAARLTSCTSLQHVSVRWPQRSQPLYVFVYVAVCFSVVTFWLPVNRRVFRPSRELSFCHINFSTYLQCNWVLNLWQLFKTFGGVFYSYTYVCLFFFYLCHKCGWCKMKLGFRKAAERGFHPPVPDPTYAYIIYTESCMKRNVITPHKFSSTMVTCARRSFRLQPSGRANAQNDPITLQLQHLQLDWGVLHRWNSLKISCRNNVNLIYQEHDHINVSFICPKFTIDCYAESSWFTEDCHCGNTMNQSQSILLPITSL